MDSIRQVFESAPIFYKSWTIIWYIILLIKCAWLILWSSLTLKFDSFWSYFVWIDHVSNNLQTRIKSKFYKGQASQWHWLAQKGSFPLSSYRPYSHCSGAGRAWTLSLACPLFHCFRHRQPVPMPTQRSRFFDQLPETVGQWADGSMMLMEIILNSSCFSTVELILEFVNKWINRIKFGFRLYS